MTTTEGTMERISAACVAAGYDEIEMNTPDARAWQLTTGPVDRMVVAYTDGAILCRTRGEGDVRCDDVVVAVAWVQATA